MTGRRIDAKPTDGNQFPFPTLQPGDYGKDINGVWHCRPPWKHAGGCLAKHNTIEHEDGTITVSPSILIECWAGFFEEGNDDKITWHGYLEKGVWREC